MGQTCGCFDKSGDQHEEIRGSVPQRLGNDMEAYGSNYRNSRVQEGMTVQGAVSHERFFADNPLLAELEKSAKSNNLQFIEELIFENGAVYKGYLQGGMRHGPGV